MTTLEDVKKSLEGMDNGSDLIAVIESSIAAEKKLGIEAKKNANKEAKGLRDRLKEMESFKSSFEKLGFDPEKSELDDFLSDIEDKMNGSGNQSSEDPTEDDKSKNKPSAEIIQIRRENKLLQRNMEKLQTQYAEAQKKEESYKVNQQRSLMKETLTSKLKDEKGNFKIHAADLFVKDLINDGKVSLLEDQKTVVFMNGDEEIDLDEGIENILKERSDLLKNNQHSGSGGAAEGGSTSDENMSDAERLKKLRGLGRFTI